MCSQLVTCDRVRKLRQKLLNEGGGSIRLPHRQWRRPS
uniref:Uncharacterized protein n=1 Tax=Peronospora matthiolae TaxID=2874970 RepID=A0AAV1TG01_9STRA